MRYQIGTRCICVGYPYSKLVSDGDKGRIVEAHPAADYPNVDHRYDIEFELPSNAHGTGVYCIEENHLRRIAEQTGQ